jgi:hypothetical protein
MKSMQQWLPIASLFVLIGAGSALADDHCNVPLAQWQTREALQQKVEAEGWTITRIKTDDGCYKVYATNDKGERYTAKYDPGTLKIVKSSIDQKDRR